MEWLYLVGIFVLVGIVMAIVGFLGNKMSDGVENAIRTRRHRAHPAQKSESVSLAQRYKSGQ